MYENTSKMLATGDFSIITNVNIKRNSETNLRIRDRPTPYHK